MATDKYAILSRNFPETGALNVPRVRTRIYGTNLIGLFCVGNSNGILLPHFISDDEIAKLSGFFRECGEEFNVGRLMDNYTAIGNLIACNDRAAIVSPMISKTETIEEILGVEAVKKKISGHDETGACCVATNKGFIVHPDAGDELREISQILRVDGLTGSVNLGFPFIKSGIIANSKGYLVGSRTTGIELGRIDEALGFMD